MSVSTAGYIIGFLNIVLGIVGIILARRLSRKSKDWVADMETKKNAMPQTHSGDTLAKFNEKFVAANRALTCGNTDALKTGISLLIEALPFAGKHLADLRQVIQYLRCALTHHDRADTKGPWNRDLSGYGLMSWKADLYERDEALQLAWPYVERINNELKAAGMGWNYQP